MEEDQSAASTAVSGKTAGFWQRRFAGVPASILTLTGIMALAALLRFVNLDAVGDGNLYYAAAVKSMLTSWENFFFAAAEPGGSVTVDKPPLGLWVQAVSAAIFGVNTFGLMLPQILAGLGSVVLVYVLVKRWFGEGAGLLGALVLAITPVSVAVERNNTMDALLIFTLLLAMWAFVQAAERSPIWLLAGGLLIGLAFNIKMLQAYLPVPAMFLYYFLAGKQRWPRRLFTILLAGLVILVVSFAWVVAVDSIPAEDRPYIGSSENNTVMELIFGHNGLNRLFGRQGADSLLAGILGDADPLDASPEIPNPDRIQPPGPAGQNPPQRPPAGSRLVPQLPPVGQPPDGLPQVGEPGQAPSTGDGIFPPPGAMAARSPDGQLGNQEIGEPGALRLFTQPLANEISWLLPLGLGMLLVLAFSSPLRFPLGRGWRVVLLWGGWLLTCLVFFSFASFFHAYYLAMLAPPLAVVIAAGTARLWNIGRKKPWLASGVLWAIAGVTFAHQVRTAGLYGEKTLWGWAAGALLAAGVVISLAGNLLSASARAHKLRGVGLVCIIAALIAAPLAWSVRTTLEENPHTGLPGAYGSNGMGAVPGRAPGFTPAAEDGSEDLFMLEYLQENTQGMKYLLAVPGSMQGAQYVLATGRPVLYLGGFNGGDPVMELAEFRGLITEGGLQFVLAAGDAGQNANADIFRWVRQSCSPVAGSAASSSRVQDRGLEKLYDCYGAAISQ